MTRTREPLPDSELEAIRNELDKTTDGGRDEQRARELADAYVADHPAEFDGLRNMTYAECVQAVSNFRADNRPADAWKVDAWILHHFDKQHIGGAFQAKIRIAPTGTR